MGRKLGLIVVDLQEDFLPSDGSLAVPEGRSIIPLINDLLDTEKYRWSTVIATQDWHPANHCSFASQHGVDPFSELDFQHPLGDKDETGRVRTMKQCVWPDHCIQNSFGSSIDPLFLSKYDLLSEELPKKIVKKGYLQDREYYSCFEDCWKLHKTEMEDYLRDQGITDVVFVGIAYDFCVLNSALDCLNAGFNAYVIKECCKSVYPDKIVDTENRYKSGNVKTISLTDSLFN